MKKQIINFVKSISYFLLDDEEELSFTTREHGNVGSEQFSQTDYKEAIRIGEEIMKKFPGTSYNIDTCDEWVNLYINIKE